MPQFNECDAIEVRISARHYVDNVSNATPTRHQICVWTKLHKIAILKFVNSLIHKSARMPGCS